ncbi:MAG: response regulator [Angelakisella sp.]
MYSLLIVDDETIVRTTLATMVNWEALGFTIVGSVPTGRAALNLIETQPVDVVLTDIKMPVMDGLMLMEHLRKLPTPPVYYVLSSYSDFDLVRKAFKLGAVDYIVKGDISAVQLEQLAEDIKKNLSDRGAGGLPKAKETSPAGQLLDIALGNTDIHSPLLQHSYYLACLEIDDFRKESLRFGKDLDVNLTQPLLQFAGQIPRVAARCVLTPVSPSRYLLLYSEEGNTSYQSATSICVQLQKVWKNYMNLSVTVGVSSLGNIPEDFPQRLREAGNNLTLKYIFGRSGVFGPGVAELFSVAEAQREAARSEALVTALKSASPAAVPEQLQLFFVELCSGTVAAARTRALQVIYHTALMLADAGEGLWDVFNTESETDFYQKITRLETMEDIQHWITNFAHWVTDYFHTTKTASNMDIMEKAKRFIAGNYADPGLNLAAVASFVGLNEKYFCTRFNKEVGVSFSAYLTDLRISMAKRMILKTDRKMYEVSEAVGFGSVEHFTRVFKKLTGTSPYALKKVSG